MGLYLVSSDDGDQWIVRADDRSDAKKRVREYVGWDDDDDPDLEVEEILLRTNVYWVKNNEG